MAVAVGHAHVVKAPVHCVVIQPKRPAAAPPVRQIKPLGQAWPTADCCGLTMQHGRLAIVAEQFDLDPAGHAHQIEPQRARLGRHRQRRQPVQLRNHQRGRRVLGQRVRERYPDHLQIGRARQGFAAADAVIAQPRLNAAEGGAELLAVEARMILVHQRVQLSARRAVLAGANRRPIAAGREGIGWQTDALALVAAGGP